MGRAFSKAGAVCRSLWTLTAGLGQTIYHRQGKASLRAAQLESLAAARNFSARDTAERLSTRLGSRARCSRFIEGVISRALRQDAAAQLRASAS